jgi:hypothetical protein
MLGVTTLSLCQVKQPPKEKFRTALKTFKVDFDNGRYWTQLEDGYEYPAIKKGYYSVGFYLTHKELLSFYEELLNIKNSEDGVYNTSRPYMDKVRGYKKSGDKIHLDIYRANAGYDYRKRIDTKYLESDIALIKEEFMSYKNKE